MTTKTKKRPKKRRVKKKEVLRIRFEKEEDWLTTHIGIDQNVEVASEEGYLCFWISGREVKLGPLSKEQAGKLAEDLAYEAV